MSTPDESTRMQDTNIAQDRATFRAKQAYPPRYVPEQAREFISDVAARDAERFAIYAEEILRTGNDTTYDLDHDGHALALAALAIVYELKAARLDRAEQGTALADGISSIRDALAEHGKFTCGEIRGLSENTGAVAYELSAMNRRARNDRGED